MALYMTQFSYTPEAWAALLKKPEDRSIPLKALCEKLGGRLLGLYYCFGEYDGVAIVEAPDNTTEMTMLLSVVAPGHIKAIKRTVLFTIQDAMQALGKAGGISYPAPKG